MAINERCGDCLPFTTLAHGGRFLEYMTLGLVPVVRNGSTIVIKYAPWRQLSRLCPGRGTLPRPFILAGPLVVTGLDLGNGDGDG